MQELSVMKTSLFQLNLSIHNLLAEVATRAPHTPTLLLPPSPAVGGGKRETSPAEGGEMGGLVRQAKDLQGEVVGIYSLWDNAHHKMAAGLSKTQVEFLYVHYWKVYFEPRQRSIINCSFELHLLSKKLFI